MSADNRRGHPRRAIQFRMQITVNGTTHTFAQDPTIAELLAQLDLLERRLAVEVNRQIVPRSLHASHRLHAGDVVELVQAIGGG